MIKYWLDSEGMLWTFQEVDEGKVIIGSDRGILPWSTVEQFQGPLTALYSEEDMLASSASPDPEEVDGIPLADLYSALVMLECPWRRGVGICSGGCREEPACQTNEPEDGWPAEIRRIVCQP